MQYAPDDIQEQVDCEHPFARLKWGGNQSSKYASCGRCGAKNVIFLEKKPTRNVFVEEEESSKQESLFGTEHEVHAVTMQKGHIMLDTGCKKSVAGRQWHRDFQKELESLGMQGKEIQTTESFRFGDGRVVTSQKTWVYPV